MKSTERTTEIAAILGVLISMAGYAYIQSYGTAHIRDALQAVEASAMGDHVPGPVAPVRDTLGGER